MMIMNSSSYQSIHSAISQQKKSYPNRIKNSVRKHAVKVVVSFLFFVLVFTSFLIMGSNASSLHIAEASESEQVVIVSSGDTLWSIASRIEDRKSSTGFMVFRIKDRNQLESETITPGQKLIIPVD